MFKILRNMIVVGAAALLVACSASQAVRGKQAAQTGDYLAAREFYRQELSSARMELKDTEVSRYRLMLATYDLGRMTGYTCDYSEAETLLLDALRLSEQMDERFSHRTAILLELARLTFDQGKVVDSAMFYTQAVERLDRFQYVNSDPIGVANLFDDHAAALKRSGDLPRAGQMRRRADLIRVNNPGKSAQFTPLYYREVCR